ncbi:MAG: hypothetical protein WC829_02175 [Hyphomicrobium sp.]|jgi:hypothetical protein
MPATGLTDREATPAGSAKERRRPVTVVVNFLSEKPGSLHVADTSETGGSCWLPRREIILEPGTLEDAMARRARRRMAPLRITMPLWLALDRGLATEASEGQGALF